jgi:glycosyltransferase involved in cell wall biosynthesis
VVKVSVIVPVYNPGSDIDDCIASLLRQSLPPEEYEVIFVDDGSTDATPARLDALAAEHPHVHVRHIPNSGWPGKPRNVGLEMARGKYVYFVDNDDWLGKDALRRLYERAERDEADLVIGRVIGEGKFVPRSIFTRDRRGVTLEWPGLLRLLTPHKLFLRAMLDEHGIRFPEGRRRLEDHLFTMHAYFHARSISVLARYPCYHWVLRDDGANASTGEFDAAGYYNNVREVLDLIDEHMEPGPLRDRVRSHWYRGKMLGRVGGRGYLDRTPAFRLELYEEVRALALERYDEGVHRFLAFNLRVRSRLLRDGHYDGLEALSAVDRGLEADVALLDAASEGDEVRLRVEARILSGERPLAFEADGDRVRWRPPPELAPLLPDDALDATEDVQRSNADFLLQREAGGPEWVLPAEVEVRLEPIEDAPGHVTPVVVAETGVDPERAAAGARLRPGEWSVRLKVGAAGFSPPPAAPLRRRRGAEEPLVLTVTPGGRLLPPGLRRTALRRFPGAVQALGRVRSKAAPGR